MSAFVQQDTTLLEALQTAFPESSNRSLRNWIKWGRVYVEGKPLLKPHVQVKKGEALSLQDKPLNQISGLPVIYQDRWMVVIEKPPGLLSVPAEKPAPNVMHLLKAGLKTTAIFPVHRLDQESSGVLVFARTPDMEEALSKLFEAHALEREYIAVVEGHLPDESGSWSCFVREKENYSMEPTTEELGKWALTHYSVVRKSKKFTFLRLKLETGRKHQIRLHASEAGFPILGDKRYGSLINPFKRLCLHAFRLSFVHPFTGKQMEFVSQSNTSHKAKSIPFPFFVPLDVC